MTVGINPPISLIVKNQKQFKACLKSFTRRPYFKLKATMFRPKLGLNEFVTLHRRQTSNPFMLHVYDFKLRECRLNYSNSFMTFCSLHTQNRNKLQKGSCQYPWLFLDYLPNNQPITLSMIKPHNYAIGSRLNQ